MGAAVSLTFKDSSKGLKTKVGPGKERGVRLTQSMTKRLARTEREGAGAMLCAAVKCCICLSDTSIVDRASCMLACLQYTEESSKGLALSAVKQAQLP